MDKLYMVILLLTIIPILICIKYARKVKSDVADSITRCLFFVTITIIGNIVFAFSQYQLVAYFMESVYLFFFDLVLIYILQYSQQYTRVFNEVSAFRIGCFIVAYLDGISLLLNTFFHHVFTLKKVSYIGIQMHCISSKTIFYDLHYVFVYCLMFCVIASFLELLSYEIYSDLCSPLRDHGIEHSVQCFRFSVGSVTSILCFCGNFDMLSDPVSGAEGIDRKDVVFRCN